MGKLIPPIIRAFSPQQHYCSEAANTLTNTYSRVFEMLSVIFMLSWGKKKFYFKRYETNCYKLFYIFSVLFGIGMKFYKKEVPANSNILVNCINCIKYALLMKIKGISTNYTWLELSIGRYPVEYVEEVWICIKVYSI